MTRFTDWRPAIGVAWRADTDERRDGRRALSRAEARSTRLARMASRRFIRCPWPSAHHRSRLNLPDAVTQDSEEESFIGGHHTAVASKAADGDGHVDAWSWSARRSPCPHAPPQTTSAAARLRTRGTYPPTPRPRCRPQRARAGSGASRQRPRIVAVPACMNAATAASPAAEFFARAAASSFARTEAAKRA
jgi:hypothetical protein